MAFEDYTEALLGCPSWGYVDRGTIQDPMINSVCGSHDPYPKGVSAQICKVSTPNHNYGS